MTTPDRAPPRRAPGPTAGDAGGPAPAWRLGALLACVGGVGALLAVVGDATAARSAAAQDWSPFVLVAGLLLVGLVAEQDGLFAAAGQRLARLAGSGTLLYAGAVVLVAVVTALLNLDTSVAFLTPVFVYTARERGGGEAPLLYGCLLLSNAGSLLLPGSNLTNLIVLGHLRLSGVGFLARMAPAWLAAVVVTAIVVGVIERRSLQAPVETQPGGGRPRSVLGVSAVVTVTVLVVTLRSPALPVLAVGVAVTAITAGRSAMATQQLGRALDVLGLPVLVGLFGSAVALGTLGRAWLAPAELLGHLNPWSTAAVAAIATVLVNNLPAASLLAARVPDHPYALLIGLNLGPNLFASGSLAWILWLRAARGAGARPSIAHASRLGAFAAPLSMAAALGALAFTGSR